MGGVGFSGRPKTRQSHSIMRGLFRGGFAPEIAQPGGRGAELLHEVVDRLLLLGDHRRQLLDVALEPHVLQLELGETRGDVGHRQVLAVRRTAFQAVSAGPSAVSTWRSSSWSSRSGTPASIASRKHAYAATKRLRWRRALPRSGRISWDVAPKAVARRSGPTASPERPLFKSASPSRLNKSAAASPSCAYWMPIRKTSS